jgi:hypothetical protein
MARAIPQDEEMNVTRRAWMLAAAGALLAASLGGFVLANRGSSAPFKPLASRGVFTPAQWKSVSASVQRRGFAASSIHVVEAVGEHDKHTLALVSATSHAGRTCFVPVQGLKLGQTICHVTKPVVLFTAPDYWIAAATGGKPAHRVSVTNVLLVARRDVTGITVDQLFDGRRTVQGLPLIEDSGRLTFAGGFADASVLRARNARGRVLFRLTFSR